MENDIVRFTVSRPKEIKDQLDIIVKQEQKQIGPSAKVSRSSIVGDLISKEYNRRKKR